MRGLQRLEYRCRRSHCRVRVVNGWLTQCSHSQQLRWHRFRVVNDYELAKTVSWKKFVFKNKFPDADTLLACSLTKRTRCQRTRWLRRHNQSVIISNFLHKYLQEIEAIFANAYLANQRPSAKDVVYSKSRYMKTFEYKIRWGKVCPVSSKQTLLLVAKCEGKNSRQ